jgi:8-oxo-dGTP pyrophosphatase MutT (NUDIX family)
MTHPLAARLVSTPEDRSSPNVRPKDAATLIILDRSARQPKVLMGRRHDAHKFMPGVFVFPGGRIEAGDRAMVSAGALDGMVERRLMTRVQRPSAQRARALAMAAIRETFEETGILLGTRDYGAPEAAVDGPWAAFAAHGVYPVLENLQFIARAITPPRRSKRFDTRFFAADATAIAHRIDGVVGPGTELVELVWIDLKDAPGLKVPPITGVILEEIRNRLDAGFAAHLPVPFYYEDRGSRLRVEIE